MKMNFKASLTAKQIMIIVVLIIGFALVLNFFYKFLWGVEVNNETCYESVVLRGTTRALSGNTIDVPLKCKTQKYCITSRLIGHECEEFEGESGIVKIKVNSKEEIEKFLAGEIVSCWKRMGEGKISLYSQNFVEKYGMFGVVYPTCVMCSRVAYDKTSLAAAKINLQQINVVQYMASHKMPDRNTSYYEYISGESGKFSVPSPVIADTILKDVINDEGITEQEFGFIAEEYPQIYNDNEIAILFMQISAPSHGTAALNVGKAALEIGIAAFNPVTGYPKAGYQTAKVIGKICTSGGWVGPVVCGAILLAAIGYQQGNIAYNRAVSASKCEDVLTTAEEPRNGCSVVRTMDYDTEDLTKYCAVVESIS